MSLRVANCSSMLRTRQLQLWRLRVNSGERFHNHYQQLQWQHIFRRSIQNLATPSHPKPTEKIIYGVEEDVEVEDLGIPGGSAAAVGKEVTSDSLSSSSVNATNRVSPSQKQATFIDKTISSTLSTSAIQGFPTSSFVSGDKSISSTIMHHHQRKSRSHSEPPRGTTQREQDHQFPQLRLNHLTPNFHALSSHGPLELYEYLSTPIPSDSPGRTNLEGQPRAKGGKQGKRGEGNWLIFFSHPVDFTPVCTTEIVSMAKLQDEFAKRGAKLLGLSIGSVEEHRRWMADVRGITERGGLHPSTVGQMVSGKVNQVGIGEEEPVVIHSVSGDESVSPLGGSNVSVSERNVGSNASTGSGGVGALDEEKEMGMEDIVGSGSIGITDRTTSQSFLSGKGEGGMEEENLLRFPIIADEDGFVAQLYGMLEDSDGEKAADPHRSEHLRTVRSLFIIDPQKRIRLMTSYPHTTGRNAAEILRALDALQRSDLEGVLTQEGWTVGDEVIIPPEMSNEDAEKRFGKGGVRTVNEYLRFAQPVLT